MVSIIMSTYKEPLDFVKKSVESILDQTFKDYEFIIVLDNPDNIELNSYIKSVGKKDSRIVVIENQKNLGLPKSLNKALKLAKGDIIARMDADDISYKNRIEEEYKYLCENDFDLISSNINLINTEDKIIKTSKEKEINNNNLLKILKVRDCMAHPTWMGKKNIFKELNGYRDIPCNEDYDFVLRAIMSKKKLGIYNECLLSYRINPNGITSSKSFISFLVFNYLRSNYKHILEINELSVSNYLNTIDIDKEQAKFEKAMDLFAKEANFVLKVYNRIKSLFASKYFRKKVLLLFKERIILRKKIW